jgi:hypothetical protein
MADREAAVREQFDNGGVPCGFVAYALDCRETGYVRGVDQSKTIRASILFDDDYWTVPELDPRRLIRKDGDAHRLLDRDGVWRDEDEVLIFHPLPAAESRLEPESAQQLSEPTQPTAQPPANESPPPAQKPAGQVALEGKPAAQPRRPPEKRLLWKNALSALLTEEKISRATEPGKMIQLAARRLKVVLTESNRESVAKLVRAARKELGLPMDLPNPPPTSQN